MKAPRARRAPKPQRGVTLLVVLVLLTVMLLGGLSLARMTETSTLAAGNAAFREAALQASEVGLNDVYARVRNLANEEANEGNWYRATHAAPDANGLPGINWDSMPEVLVGAADKTQYSVRYFAERMCEGALPVGDPLRQCLVKQIPQTSSADATKEKLDPPNSKQFRLTIRVTGPKGTQTFVQSLMTKG